MSTCSTPTLTRLFVLADSISIHYGPYLEQFLAGRYVCDRKGRELLAAESDEDFQEVGAASHKANDGAERSSAAPLPDHAHPPADSAPARVPFLAPHPGGGILSRLGALDPGLPEFNGGDSRAVLAYLRERAPKCDALLLNCGLHDLKVDPHSRARQVPLDEYARNLSEILHRAQGCAQRVIWVRTTPVDDEVHNRLKAEFQRFNADVFAYNAVADACVRSSGITSVDLYNFCGSLAAGEPGGLAALIEDHVHFTLPVRKLQAAYLAGQLEALHGA